MRIFHANEYLADYYSARDTGLLPMVNSLLKISSRAQVFEDILSYLEVFKQTYQIPDDAEYQFFACIETCLPHILKGERSIASYGSEILQRYIQQHGGNMRSVGRAISQQAETTIEKVREKHAWKASYEKIDWQIFDTHIRDMWIDEVELQHMYVQLKHHNAYRLFLPNSQGKEDHQLHPRLRERILFLVDALRPHFLQEAEKEHVE